MQLIELDLINEDSYKQKKIPENNSKLTARNILEKPEKLLLAARFCDGTFRKVNSHIKSIIKKKKDLIRRGLINDIISEINPDEAVHGQRFIIFKNGKKQAFLLGNLLTAFKQLTHR